MTAPRLRMTGVRKSYGPTAALRGVDLELRPGEVHALVGENGAGKSTLMKVLSGAEEPGAGTMDLDGAAYRPTGPQTARERGVAMIYQELAVCPDLTVAGNVLLGLEATRFGFLRKAVDRERVAAALAQLGHPEISPDAPVSALAPAARQVVEIARALVSDVKVLVLDEPTSALTQEDAARLFALVKRLKGQGVTVVYISHFLEEIEAVADRFTVLRDGQAVGGGRVGEVSRDRIVELMVGRTGTEHYPRVPHAIGTPVLELADLRGEELPDGVGLVLRRGEILGIAGIVGSGRTELLRAVYGLDPVRAGRVTVGAHSGARFTPAERIAQGVGMVSEDRKTEGLALDLSIADNLTLSRLDATAGFLARARLRTAVGDLLRRFGVRYRDAGQAVGELSGGNQQKVALARLFHQRADVLLLDEPTKGVDVGSKADIYRQIGAAAAEGKAVLVVSSYLPELFGVCDTLAVMCRGKLTAPRPVTEWTPEAVIAAATGA
ncbi:sugar ABC transporter ATP-binding protein [Frigoriglobus tundricola]|uniref:Ribose import ATP-binding protein RbsA n=1 Tax=Frigoriglobus tundricola TaxID=2774151 RepID=A0A6M5Z0W7_9BACT|nr:sugar ABC transporter ATP-binding protein [Frigoriglobus tundricola]QJW98852.1 Ribose import ATP-binding protein RbsA [Frigoriglobus tundricola]